MPLTILLFVLVGALVLGVALFYGLQQYLVYDQNGVTLQLPGMGSGENTTDSASASAQASSAPAPVQVEIIYEDPDFSDISLVVGEDLSSTKALFVAYKDVVDSVALATKISGAKSQGCDGLILEMKPQSGQLAWGSMVEIAVGYGTSGTQDYTQTIETIHDQGLTAVAQISCCADTLLATRNWTVALQTADGAPYADSDGVYWLDPYNHTVRTYLIDLMNDLAAMGFDEIILADLYHPVSDAGFSYTVTLQTEPKPTVAVCQLARKLAEAMEGSGVRVSALISADSLRNDRAAATGQDLDVFWRLFDRLYCPSDANTASSDLEKAASYLAGSASNRFVPVCTYSAPEGFDSWVLKIPDS